MKPGWTIEWYIEHQFSDEVRRWFREQDRLKGGAK